MRNSGDVIHRNSSVGLGTILAPTFSIMTTSLFIAKIVHTDYWMLLAEMTLERRFLIMVISNTGSGIALGMEVQIGFRK